MTPEKAYIVILNYNSWEDSIECLQSLCQQSYPFYEIVVVDNFSTNDSRTQLLDWANRQSVMDPLFNWQLLEYRQQSFLPVQSRENSRLSFIWSDKNGGFAYGNNIGIRYSLQQSSSHFIWLLNNDTVVLKDTLQTLTSFFRFHNHKGKAGLIGCLQRYYHNPAIVQTMYGRYNSLLGLPHEFGAGLSVEEAQKKNPEKIDYLSGACLLTHSNVLQQIGLLCEDYFLFFEEIDLAQRLKRAGYQLLFCPDTSILHKHGTSINGGNKGHATPFADFHHFRSEYIFVRKYHKPLIPLYLLVSGLQLTNRLIRGRFKNIRSLVKGVEAGLSHSRPRQ